MPTVTYKGTHEDPVRLDPFQTIRKVGWRTGGIAILTLRMAVETFTNWSLDGAAKLLIPPRTIFVGRSVNEFRVSDPSFDFFDTGTPLIPVQADFSRTFMYFGGKQPFIGSQVGGDINFFINTQKIISVLHPASLKIAIGAYWLDHFALGTAHSGTIDIFFKAYKSAKLSMFSLSNRGVLTTPQTPIAQAQLIGVLISRTGRGHVSDLQVIPESLRYNFNTVATFSA